jgi:hypothetical protein
VDAEHGDVDATVGLAGPAGVADSARDIRVDHAYIACRNRRGGRRLHDLDGEFVAHDPGVFEIGVLAFEDVVVGAAYADPARPDQRVVGAAGLEPGLRKLQPARRDTDKGTNELHVEAFQT